MNEELDALKVKVARLEYANYILTATVEGALTLARLEADGGNRAWVRATALMRGVLDTVIEEIATCYPNPQDDITRIAAEAKAAMFKIPGGVA